MAGACASLRPHRLTAYGMCFDGQTKGFAEWPAGNANPPGGTNEQKRRARIINPAIPQSDSPLK